LTDVSANRILIRQAILRGRTLLVSASIMKKLSALPRVRIDSVRSPRLL
jgi:hypothetical protein